MFLHCDKFSIGSKSGFLSCDRCGYTISSFYHKRHLDYDIVSVVDVMVRFGTVVSILLVLLLATIGCLGVQGFGDFSLSYQYPTVFGKASRLHTFGFRV